MTRYIGLMSGTSTDGIDAVLVDMDDTGLPTVIDTHTEEFDPDLRQRIEQAIGDPESSGNFLAALNIDLGRAYAACVETIASGSDNIRAIGCHGQTVLHRPEHGFSLQLGSGAVIAAKTGIDTVNDFRATDLALGGQGAPLVPAFHQALFTSPDEDRVVLNLGGISNITWVPASGEGTFGFDTGPANTLIDTWALQQLGKAYDEDGDFAASGDVHAGLLFDCLADPYFAKPFPKSTGRELFNTRWLNARLGAIGVELAPADVQATLTELTARSIADAIETHCASANTVYVCGGGTRNSYLLSRIKMAMPQRRLKTTDALGVDPQWVEAIAFAWLAWCHVNARPGNLPAVTGARREAVLGSFWPA